MTPNDDSTVSKNWCNTHIKVDKFDFLWSIENFSYCREENGQSFKSSFIKSDKKGKLEWCLKIYPKGEREESKDYLALYLNLNECDRSEVMAKYVFYIINEDGEKSNASEATGVRKFIKGKGWGFEKFIKRDVLFDKSKGLLPNDKLTIFCEISIVCDTINTISYSRIGSYEKNILKITKDVSSMFESSRLADCCIRVGDTTLDVHKFMLASRSDVFYTMFYSKFRESQSHLIEIEDFQLDVVKEMINYIYTDTSPNLEEMTCEILAIAEKYNLEGLKNMAEDSLIDRLDVKNVCEYLEMGEVYSAESLKKKCIEFIVMNISNVANTKSWSNLVNKYPLLPHVIVKSIAGDKISNINISDHILKEEIELESETS